MAGKRKARKPSPKEEKTSVACPDTTAKEQKIASSTFNSNAKGANVENEACLDSGGLTPKKTSKVAKASLRRSNRIKTSASPSGVEVVVEHVNLVETENEEANDPIITEPNLQEGNLQDAKQVQEVSAITLGNIRNMEEKVDYLVHTVDGFKLMINGRTYDSGSTDLSYKSLYFNAQKKIEALLEENNQLIRELEFARGKVEAYENMKNAFSSSKEVIVVSSLGNPNEAASFPQWTGAAAIDAANDHKNKNDAEADARASPKQKQNHCNKKKRKC